MLVVDGELRPKVHITPSRVDLFSSGRKILEFFSLDELARRLQSSAVAVPLWDRLLRRLRGMDVKKPQEKLLRFQKSYLHQKAICLISFFLLAAMFSREMEEGPLEYVDEGEYQEKMILEKQAADREPLVYLVDSSAVRPFLKQSEPYLIQKEPLPAPADQYGPASQRPGLIVHRRGDRFFEYGCERLYEKVGPQFVIAVELFDEITPLKELIRRFNEKGLNAMGLWLGCFTYQEDDFVLFLDQLYASREEAVRDAGDWQKRLESEGFSAKLEILSLQKNY